jgi:gliding motility-associated-like protein
MKTLLYSAILIFSAFGSYAQLQNNYWTFGYNCKVDFSGAVPNGMTTSASYSNEQCATVSDEASGQLLFYTDGQKVWNANNQTMPNGLNLFGGAFLSCTQGPVIVPFPDDPTKYYIFTMDDLEYDVPQLDNGLRYTVVDMTLNSGLGDVDPLQKNIFLTDFLSEKMTVVRSEAIRGYWVIVHKKESDQFLAYKVDGCGVDPNPVSSNVGTVLLGANSNFDARMPFYGSMKANNTGDRIAMPIDDSKLIDFYSFDNATGILSNALTIEVTDNTPGSPIRKYGCSFSPDGSKFYYTNNISVFQVDLTNYDSLSIANSHTLIATPAFPTFQIEEAIDGKLYVAIGGSNVLDAINSPNNPGASCGYVSNAVSLNGMCLLGLPAKVHERNFSSPAISFLPDLCLQSNISFSIASTSPINQISWDFGDPNSGPNNTADSINPTHLFSAAGNYTVTAIIEFDCYTDTVEQFLTITAPYQIAIEETITDVLCGSAFGSISTTVSGGTGPYTYSWTPNGESTSSLNDLTAGTYALTVTDDAGCSVSESYTIANSTTLPVTVTPTTATIEPGDSVQLLAAGAPNYFWSNSGTLSCSDCSSPIASPTSTTTYTVTGTDDFGCIETAQAIIIVEIDCDELFVPTVFSPNGEGPETNNQLCIFGNCISEVRYEVYNRWGEAVFSTTDESKCWDGTYKGEPLQTGIYMYRIYAKLFDGTIVEQSGNLTILK